MSPPRVLVAGIGNIFFGDDGFGCEVARRLLGRRLSGEVRVVDFGIRGVDLSFALLEGYEKVFLVDTVRRGGRPGQLYLIEPFDPAPRSESQPTAPLEFHGAVPQRAVELAYRMEGKIPAIQILGCEPHSFGDSEQGRLGLSPVVEAAVEEAVSWLESLLKQCLAKGGAACMS